MKQIYDNRYDLSHVEKNCFLHIAKTKVNTLCFCYIDSTIPLLPKPQSSSLQPSSVVVKPRLCQTWCCFSIIFHIKPSCNVVVFWHFFFILFFLCVPPPLSQPPFFPHLPVYHLDTAIFWLASSAEGSCTVPSWLFFGT